MTQKQKEQFNIMRTALCEIAHGYLNPNQMSKTCKKYYGLDYLEALEMAYENIQNEAKIAIKGVRAIR